MQISTLNPPSPTLSVRLLADDGPYQDILTPEALNFLAALHQKFEPARRRLLQERIRVQEQIDGGWLPDFLEETADIRQGDWTVSRIPADLQDRRVEITGPVNAKMVINALNSGAKVFMADFEDSNAPYWDNNLQGQQNLYAAIRRTLTYTAPETGKDYKLCDKPATLMIRPRGWHMEEKHLLIGDEPISASLFDFGLYFFHNVVELLQRGSGPYCYLPKMESYKEARLWNEVFVFAQNYLEIPQGSIKATVLIETILATFQLHEILFELRQHSAGLNCGRWDYIFSFIKKFRNRPGFLFPDRAQVTMTVPCMRAYTQLVIQTCHQRGIHAMGGMAAQIPIRNDDAANEAALERVRQDKLREVTDGHDGTWVAHPGLVPLAMEVFDAHMPDANQIASKPRTEFRTAQAELLAVPQGTITEAGLRQNINVGILYIESWLRGNGAAAIYNLMEDAATAEISRTQVWQWLHNNAQLEDGRCITQELYHNMLAGEVEKIRAYVGEPAYNKGRFDEAIVLFDRLVRQEQFTEFLTQPAYAFIQ